MNKSYTAQKARLNKTVADDTELYDEFIKKYSNIKFMPVGASFNERLMFDIYKRKTKMERYEHFKKQSLKKIPEIEKELTFQRLIKDSERRQLKSEKIQEVLKVSPKQKRKLTVIELENLIERFQQFNDVKNKTIQEKKAIKEFQQEIDIIESTQPAFKGSKPTSTFQDSYYKIQINEKQKQIALEKERNARKLKEESELNNYFKPKISSTPKFNTSVFERLQRDIEKRSLIKSDSKNNSCLPFSPI